VTSPTNQVTFSPASQAPVSASPSEAPTANPVTPSPVTSSPITSDTRPPASNAPVSGTGTTRCSAPVRPANASTGFTVQQTDLLGYIATPRPPVVHTSILNAKRTCMEEVSIIHPLCSLAVIGLQVLAQAMPQYLWLLQPHSM
jgi:hypothetical protein